ncbi:hypothetical protein SAY86_023232 [Trapa natans]|uniref:Xyloglucan endo-transglycosylase C-terminal domain-containing protein n=1 Tax=Trapa natans TaxID=22666 RepID=A0AAN7R7N9_TRANT|nr:hypothetical protein SAY86_023232 [Trapa natans]
MAVSRMSVVFGLVVGIVMAGTVSSAKFDDLFQPSWAADHHIREGDVLKLKLDYYSGGASQFWWDDPTVSELSLHQSNQLKWVRANHLVYDYCTDTARFPVEPEECVHHRH